MNNTMVLIPLVEGVSISDLVFDFCPFWIQIHGLPVEKMTRANTEIIGKRAGKLLAVEAESEGLLITRSFLRVKVELNITHPIPKGIWIRRKAESSLDIWISFKYEKLSDFCYDCGRIGHDNRVCKFVSREEGVNSGYGPEFRTGRAKKSHAPIEEVRNRIDMQKSGPIT